MIPVLEKPNYGDGEQSQRSMLRDGFRTTNNSFMMPVSAEAEKQTVEQPATTTTLSYMRKAPSQTSIHAPSQMDHETSSQQQ